VSGNDINERNRYLVDNFEIIDYEGVGSLSFSIKIKGKVSGVFYLLKVIRKLKYGKYQKRAYNYFVKYKAIVSIHRILSVGSNSIRMQAPPYLLG
jgi:hypothetical protein